MCNRCNQRPAVVFVTKVENGEKKNEGLCLSCAKELGMPQGQFDNIIEQMGMTPEEFEAMSQEIMENPPEITPEMINEMMPMMQNMFSGIGGMDPEAQDEQSSKTTKTKKKKCYYSASTSWSSFGWRIYRLSKSIPINR